jgi:hypothetical protein
MPAPLVGLAAGAAARAIAKKAAQTAVTKAAAKASAKKIGRATGSVNVNSKGKVTEYMSGAKVKGKARNISDNAHRAELEAKGYSKRASVTKYPTKKLVGNPDKLTTAKVPVKTASRTRSGQKAK